MANWAILKAAIADVVKTNGNQEITGQALQNVLNSIVNNLGENATFAGVAQPNTNPGTFDGPVFFIATKKGTYVNFKNFELSNSPVIFYSKTGNNNYDIINLGVTAADMLVGCIKAELKDGYYNNHGLYINVSDWQCTTYLPTDLVKISSINLVGTSTVSLVAFYNSNKNFISGSISAAPNRLIEIPSVPENAAYFTISFSKTDSLAQAILSINFDNIISELNGIKSNVAVISADVIQLNNKMTNVETDIDVLNFDTTKTRNSIKDLNTDIVHLANSEEVFNHQAYIDDDGAYIEDTSYLLTDLIRINPSTGIRIKNIYNSDGHYAVIFYDISESFIGGIKINNESMSKELAFDFSDIDSNTAFFSVCSDKETAENVIIINNSILELSNSVENLKFNQVINNEDISNIKSNIVTLSNIVNSLRADIVSISQNLSTLPSELQSIRNSVSDVNSDVEDINRTLINNMRNIANNYIFKVNGCINENGDIDDTASDFVCTELLILDHNFDLNISGVDSGDYYSVAFYDENFNFIEGRYEQDNLTLDYDTIAENAVYYRVCNRTQTSANVIISNTPISALANQISVRNVKDGVETLYEECDTLKQKANDIDNNLTYMCNGGIFTEDGFLNDEGTITESTDYVTTDYFRYNSKAPLRITNINCDKSYFIVFYSKTGTMVDSFNAIDKSELILMPSDISSSAYSYRICNKKLTASKVCIVNIPLLQTNAIINSLSTDINQAKLFNISNLSEVGYVNNTDGQLVSDLNYLSTPRLIVNSTGVYRFKGAEKISLYGIGTNNIDSFIETININSSSYYTLTKNIIQSKQVRSVRISYLKDNIDKLEIIGFSTIDMLNTLIMHENYIIQILQS